MELVHGNESVQERMAATLTTNCIISLGNKTTENEQKPVEKGGETGRNGQKNRGFGRRELDLCMKEITYKGRRKIEKRERVWERERERGAGVGKLF